MKHCRKFLYIACVMLLAAAGSTSAGIEDGLVAYWNFDGGNAIDQTDNGNDGIIHGDPVTVLGACGGAIEFDGIDDYIDCDNNPSLIITGNQISLCAWAQLPDAHESDYGAIISKGPVWLDGSSSDYFAYTLRTWEKLDRVGGALNSETNNVVQAYTDVLTDHWIFVALTYDGDSLRIYIDGQQTLSLKQTGNIKSSAVIDSQHVSIGAVMNRGIDSLGYFLDGLIDEVRVYNRVLENNEILELYALCTDFCDLNLDGTINPVDVVLLVNCVYKDDCQIEDIPACPGINGDWDCDGTRTPVDVVYYVNCVYKNQCIGPCDPCDCDPYPGNCPPLQD